MVQVKTINRINFLRGRPLQCCDRIPTQKKLAVLGKKNITVHVYKNKSEIFYCLYSNILYISTTTLDKAGDYVT